MFGHGYIGLHNHQQGQHGYHQVTLTDRIGGIRNWVKRMKNPSMCGVQQNTATSDHDLARQISQNDTYAVWFDIYSRFRNRNLLSFKLPKCAKLRNYSTVLKYTVKYPNSQVAVCFNLAEAIISYQRNTELAITLKPTTVSYWRHHRCLKNIVNLVASAFHRALTNQINNEATPISNIVRRHF